MNPYRKRNHPPIPLWMAAPSIPWWNIFRLYKGRKVLKKKFDRNTTKALRAPNLQAHPLTDILRHDVELDLDHIFYYH